MFGVIFPAFAVEERVITVDASVNGTKLSYSYMVEPELETGYLIRENSVKWGRDCVIEEEGVDINSDLSNICDELLSINSDNKADATVNGDYYVFSDLTIVNPEGVEQNTYFIFDSVHFKVEPTLDVNVVAKNGVLSYEAIVSNYEGEYVFSQTWKNGSEEVGIEQTFTPEIGGNYNVTVNLHRVDENGGNEQEIICSKVSDDFSVMFPVIDESQFEKLVFRAGERFSKEYIDITGLIVDIDAALGGENLSVVFENGRWLISGEELFYSGEFNLNLTAYSEGGFKSELIAKVKVLPGVIDLASSTLSVLYEEEIVKQVMVNSGYLNIVFEAHDRYGNKINIKKLDRVDVRLNGILLEGTDYLGKRVYKVERSIAIPKIENLDSNVTVDIFSSECEGVLGKEDNYCFSKIHKFAIYDENVQPVNNLVYVERTKGGVVTISGTKVSGCGIKLNTTSSEFIVEPNSSTQFSFEMPLAEGLNIAHVYAVKFVSDELELYSVPVKVAVTKDSFVAPIQWKDPAIVLDGENQATLHWIDPVYLDNDNGDFIYVNIYRSSYPNFVPNEYNLVVQTHNPSWTDTNLVAGNTYYYAIEAVDNLGNRSDLSPVMASGSILGEAAATISPVYANEEQIILGKGTGGEVISDTDDVEQSDDELIDDDQKDDDSDETESDGIVERIGNTLQGFFSNLGNSISTFFTNVTSNIFVQICGGGLLIFVGLMFLISLLVWLKEKIVDARIDSIEDDDKKEKSKK